MKPELEFFKMVGSGNDFVFVDSRDVSPGELDTPKVIRRICERRTGVGADGIVFLDRSEEYSFKMRYYNSDGTRASFCGNAALCATRLAFHLEAEEGEGEILFEADSGILTGRIHPDGLPEIDLPPISEVTTQLEVAKETLEYSIGYALVGVPHVVVLCENSDDVDLMKRGRSLRYDPSFHDGANVNFVSRQAASSSSIVPLKARMRTYERGVEGETLACGSGAVASAALLVSWSTQQIGGEAEVEIGTSSGLPLYVKLLSQVGDEGELELKPVLRGEGRVVFSGQLFDY